MSNNVAKSVAIFCTSLELGGEPIASEYYWEAYQDLMFALKDRGIEVYFATGNDSYLGHGRFKTAFTTGIRVANPNKLKMVQDVSVSVVLERAESEPFRGRDITVVNPKSIRAVANNKIAIYENFPSIQPRSAVVHTLSELHAAVDRMDGDRVVIKEPESYGGAAVYIGLKAEAIAQVPENCFPLLVQEFLDTSGGVPGQGRGIHDVRIEICGGMITSYHMRIAKPGAYHSNVSLGGSKTFLSLDQVPHELTNMVRQIDQKFTSKPRFYSADFVHSPGGWRLIELNDYVGIDPIGAFNASATDRDEAAQKFARLADYLASLCDAPVPVSAGR